MATITGTAGNDTLFGTPDPDTIEGLGGDDVLEGRGGDDRLDGGDGRDRLNGGAGADLMIGGAGDDLFFADDRQDNIIEHAGGGDDRVIATVENYVLRLNVETLTLGAGIVRGTGNAQANIIVGNDEANWLNGAEGADTLYGGYGDDTYFVDDAGDKLMERLTGGWDRAIASISYTLGNHIEELRLIENALNGTGNELANRIVGTSADNLLDGAGGADVMVGGDGDDTYIIDHPGDRIAEGLNAGIDTARSSISYILSAANVENLVLTGAAAINGIGNDLDNTLTGNAADNLLRGGLGDDLLIGGLGLDTASYTDATSGVTIDLNFDVQSDTGGMGTDTYSGIEGVRGSHYDDTIIGDDETNFLHGDAGNDRIHAGFGHDEIFGGAGDDILDGSYGSDTIDGHLGNDTIYGGEGDNILYGGEGDDWIQGGGWRDTVFGGAGDDYIDGSTGYDTLYGGFHADTIYGGKGNDKLHGEGGNDQLFGGYHDDYLYGGGGDDVLDGGPGSDHVYGGVGNDVVTGTWAYGEAGDDQVSGSSVYGGLGNDILDGEYHFFDTLLDPVNNVDQIMNFNNALPRDGGDVIRLARHVFGAPGDGYEYFHVGSSAAEADDRIIYDQPTGRIFFDPDGIGAEEQVLFATVTPGLSLQAYHFEFYFA